MELYSGIKNLSNSLIGRENRKSPRDAAFEQAILSDPSKTEVDITSNTVHREAVQYNKGMNMQALLRSEISHYLSWAAIGVFGTALGTSAVGQLGTFMTAISSPVGLALVGTAVALAATAIYVKVNNTKIQSEKNMNLGEFEMRRSAKIMAQEMAKEMKQETDPELSTTALTQPNELSGNHWQEYVAARDEVTAETSQHLH